MDLGRTLTVKTKSEPIERRLKRTTAEGHGETNVVICKVAGFRIRKAQSGRNLTGYIVVKHVALPCMRFPRNLSNCVASRDGHS